MEYLSNVSSEEELSRLRRQGKITEGEYGELLGAMGKSATEIGRASSSEPEFEAFRTRVLTGVMIMCAIGL
jgi:hypothetical protein